MPEVIQITEENFKKAYDNGCEDVRKTLRLLYPKIIIENSTEYRGYIHDKGDCNWVDEDGEELVVITEIGEWGGYGGRSIWLSDNYNWEIKRIFGELLLIPSPKY